MRVAAPGVISACRRSATRCLLVLVALQAAGCGGRSGAAGVEADVARIRAATKSRESGFMVTVRGTVDRILDDDEVGSRHQRFIIEVEPDLTLLISHNIDLAERVPLEVADSVVVRGQYEWNSRGGVLHWTHRDPSRRRESGWIRHHDRVFR